jgi:flagellar hook-length control protein FliK
VTAAAAATAAAATAAAAASATAATGSSDRAALKRQTSPVPQDDAGGTQAADARTGTPTPQVQDPSAIKGGGLTQAQAKAALDLTVPGVKLQTKLAAPAAEAPAAPAKPALTELLSQPKPEVDSPRILTPGTAEFTAIHGTGATVTPQAAPAPATAPPATGAESGLAMGAPGVTPGTRVPAPAATLEAPPAAQHSSLVSQVDGSIKWLLKNQDQSAELQLHPESLGTVRIKLTVDGTEVHARLWASDPAALPTLHENRAFLEASLRDQGLTLGSFNLQQGRQGEQTPLPGQATGSASSSSVLSIVGQETPTALEPLPSDAHRIEIVA